MIAAEPKIHRWSRAEYRQMLDLGWFIDCRAELIDGEVVELPAMKNAHAVSLKLTENALNRAFGAGYWVRSQLPLALSEYAEPIPDIAVVPGEPRDFKDHPETALLVVEISDTTLAYDRRRKGSLYSASGLAEYWIVNLVDQQLEVYRDPVVDENAPRGWRYGSATTFDPKSHVSVGSGQIHVADLLP